MIHPMVRSIKTNLHCSIGHWPFPFFVSVMSIFLRRYSVNIEVSLTYWFAESREQVFPHSLESHIHQRAVCLLYLCKSDLWARLFSGRILLSGKISACFVSTDINRNRNPCLKKKVQHKFLRQKKKLDILKVKMCENTYCKSCSVLCKSLLVSLHFAFKEPNFLVIFKTGLE